MIGKKVLIIDDDVDIQGINEKVFRNIGSTVKVANNGIDGVKKFFLEKPDLVITDIMMPEMDGFETCSRIRQVSNVPVIMLTALNSEEEIIRGLESGADDFISKPFSPEVLVARARALLRRLEMPRDSVVVHGQYYSDGYLTIDLEKRIVLVKGDSIKLTRTEYNLLAYLLQNAGWVRTFDQILENVWGPEYQGSLDYVHVYMSNLRKKIEADQKNPMYLESEHGVGYRFNKRSTSSR
jgi:two-component system KDP operon response regulator KdpE